MSNIHINTSFSGDPLYPPGVTGHDIDAHGGGDGSSQYCKRCDEFMWPEDESSEVEGCCKACAKAMEDEEDALDADAGEKDA